MLTVGSSGFEAFRATLRARFRPMPPLRLSEWAEQHAVLSAESSSEHGRWSAYPYQVGIMDAFTDHTVETITVMKSARVGWTKILNHAIAFAMVHDPAPILLVQPTIDDARGYAKDELGPMLRDTPALAGRVTPARYGKITFKRGALTIVGSNAPRSFRRLTVKRVFFDEVDGYDARGAGKGANAEGDQIKLGVRRADTYPDRKIALGSTPKRAGTSRIAASFARSDKRRYHVPCPDCGEQHVLLWAQFSWPAGQPEQVRWVCPSCAAAVDYSAQREMVEGGEWRAEAPFRGHAGFHIWAAYSYSPAAEWSRLAAEWEETKGEATQEQVFVNTVLGEAWEDTGARPDEGSLRGRAVAEAWDGAKPAGVLVETAGVDVQDDRVEIELVGWGVGWESWSLERHVIWGDPARPALWAELDEWLLDRKPEATAIDSGGHHTQAVYDFCASRFARRVYAIKGAAGEGRKVWPHRASKPKRGVTLFVIGVDSAKDAIYAWLRVGKPGPGYCHVPADRDASWFAGITSEIVVIKHSRGFPIREYQRRKPAQGMPEVPNEPLDCRVYAYAALCSFGNIVWAALAKRIAARRAKLAERVSVERPSVDRPREEAPPIKVPAPVVDRAGWVRPRSGFVRRWR